MFKCQNVLPRADMNGDYIYTISDLWLQIKTIYLLPANALVDLTLPSSPLARFLELDCWSTHGIFGVIFSAYLWWLILMMLGGLLAASANAAK